MGQSGVILLDTHVVLWLAEGSGKLSARASAAIGAAQRSQEALAISDMTLAELAIAFGRRRFSLTVPLDEFLAQTESRFTVLPITARACARMAGLPASFPRDPADRIIAATALVHGLPLVTADRVIRKSRAVETIW
jgi:PIN domain nuclease of toxin-antitoxin system